MELPKDIKRQNVKIYLPDLNGKYTYVETIKGVLDPSEGGINILDETITADAVLYIDFDKYISRAAQLEIDGKFYTVHDVIERQNRLLGFKIVLLTKVE